MLYKAPFSLRSLNIPNTTLTSVLKPTVTLSIKHKCPALLTRTQFFCLINYMREVNKRRKNFLSKFLLRFLESMELELSPEEVSLKLIIS